MNILKSIMSGKKIATFLLVLVFALTLVACGTPSGNPTGSINDDIYLTVGTGADEYKVTNKELYDQLKLSSLGRLTTFIDELVFSDVKLSSENIKDLTTFEVSAFEQEINTALFSSATITAKQLSSQNERTIAQRILSFADSFVITNPAVAAATANFKNTLIEFLQVVVADVIAKYEAGEVDETADFIFGYININKYPTYSAVINGLVSQYKLSVLKKVYAKSVLGEYKDGAFTNELADKDSSVYVSEENIVSHYESNIKGQYNVSALIIPFTNLREYELATFKYSIKSNARGEWFEIPNIAKQDIIDQIKNANNTQPHIVKARKILTDTIADGGLGLTLADLKTIDFRSTEFSKYYSKYQINSTQDAAIKLNDSIVPSQNQVLEVFLKIYADLTQKTDLVPTSIGQLAPGQAFRTTLEEKLTLSYDDLVFTANTNLSQLRTYVYGLDSEALYNLGTDEDGNEYTRPYSRQSQTFNNTPYLVYLLSDKRADDEGVIVEDADGNKNFADKNDPNRLKSIEEIVKARLTSTYITSQTTKKYEDSTIDIYDSQLRALYKNQNTSYKGSEGFKNNNVLASVNGTDITVDSFFQRVEETLGLSTALDVLLMKKLTKQYGVGETGVSEEKFAEFTKQLQDQYVNPFLANNYESAGFPATMGLDNFLLVAFRAYENNGKSATRDAIDKIYIQPYLRQLFQEDLTTHYGQNTATNNIYEKLTTLANQTRTTDLSVDASHLLVYLDLDNDGTNDDPAKIDYAKAGLNGINSVEDLNAKIEELNGKINQFIKNYSTVEEGLNKFVEAYNSTTRFELTIQQLADLGPNPTQEQLEAYVAQLNPNDKWVEYRRLGFKVLYQSLSTISNQTNFPGQQSSLDVKFFDYAMALANHLVTISTEDGADVDANTLVPLYSGTLFDSADQRANFSGQNAQSSFGYHMILITKFNNKLSAKTDDTNTNASDFISNTDNPYAEGVKLTGFNDQTDNLTWQQVLIYIEESKQTEIKIGSLTSDVLAAITKYYTPVKTMYDNTYSQLELAFNYLFDGNVEIKNNTALNQKLVDLRDANFNQFFQYSVFKNVDGTGNTIYDKAFNQDYYDLYGNWFTVLER